MSIINSNYLDLTRFTEEFINKKPFPYIILDNFLEKEFFQQISEEKNKINYEEGKNFSNEVEKNKWISKNTQLPDKIKKIIDQLNSEKWIENLKQLTKIESLFSTNVGNTDLANYHEMSNNGFLGSHVDHSADPESGRPHVLNIILYLSEGWKLDWGGSTTLMNDNGKEVIKSVEYIPNRATIFLHTPYSFHGVSEIKNNNIKRSSIYVDYYSSDFNPFKNYKFDFDNKWFKHGTCFVLPSLTDYLKPKNFYYTKTRIKYLVNKFFN